MAINSNRKFVFIHHPAQKLHFQNICEISDDQLGKGYLNDILLQKKNENENVIFNVVLHQSKVVGFYILYIPTKKHDLFIELKIKNKYATESSLIIKTIAIANEYQNKGITTAIFNEINNIAVDRNLHKIFCFAWQHQTTEEIPMSKILIKNGYSQIQIIDDFWKEDSVLRNFECPICGNPPCLCSLVIFEKK